MRQSRLPPTQGERRKATTWVFNGSWSRLSPWPRLPPPARRCIKDRTRAVWVGEKQPVWVARESRALGPTTKVASLDEAPALSGSLLPTRPRGLGVGRRSRGSHTVRKAKSAEIEKFERKKTGARTGARHVSWESCQLAAHTRVGRSAGREDRPPQWGVVHEHTPVSIPVFMNTKTANSNFH